MEAQLIIPVSIYPHKDNKTGRVTAHYFWLKDLFVPDITSTLVKTQFCGVHQSLMFTLIHPSYLTGLLSITNDLDRIYTPGRGKITWIGMVSCYTIQNTAKFYVPNKVWKSDLEVFNHDTGVFHTKGIIYKYAPTRKSQPYVLVDIPAITREAILAP